MRLQTIRRNDHRGTPGFRPRELEILNLDPTTGQWTIVRQGESVERAEQPRFAEAEKVVLAALATVPERRLDAPTIRLS